MVRSDPRNINWVGSTWVWCGWVSPPIRANAISASVRPISAMSWLTTETGGDAKGAASKSSKPMMGRVRPVSRNASSAPIDDLLLAAKIASAAPARTRSATIVVACSLEWAVVKSKNWFQVRG